MRAQLGCATRMFGFKLLVLGIVLREVAEAIVMEGEDAP
jgi:hypothetical protein